MNANVTTLHKRPNDTEINNYRYSDGIQQSPYHIVNYKRARNDNVKQFKRGN